MKTVIIFILLFVLITCLFKPVKEGMISSSYNDCISKGFTKEFCVQTPFAGNVVGTHQTVSRTPAHPGPGNGGT